MDRRRTRALDARPRTGPPGALATGDAIEVHVLGGFELTVAGRHVQREDWCRRSGERLVKLLLVTRGHAISREAAAELLWPGAAPESSRASLRKAIHFASRALGATRAIRMADDRVGLDPACLDLDLDRLEGAFDVLARPSTERDAAGSPNGPRAKAVDTVLTLGGLDLLPDDVYEDWLVGPRERLRGRWQRTALDAARAARDEGLVDRALDIVDRILERDPTDEAAHRLAIEMLAAQGRHHAVRRQFDLCRRAMLEDLDAEPSAETVEAFRAAQRAAAHNAGPTSPLPRLVARDAELRRLERLVDEVAAGRPGVVAIHGPTGIGKTRLLRALVDAAHAAGWGTLEWQALEATATSSYAPLGMLHAGVVDASEVAAWAEPARSGIASACPGLGIPPAIAFANREALVDALVLGVERLAQTRPLLVAIDDLQWLDDATTDLLRRVVAELPHAPILVATTHRDGEQIPPAAARLIEQARRLGDAELVLAPVGAGHVESLITANLGGTAVESELAGRAFELSEGNPLFCLELVRAWRAAGTVRLVDERWVTVPGVRRPASVDVPETVRRLVANRTARLTGAPLELLGTAAELEAEFSFDTLVAVLPDLEGGLLAALDQALDSGLLVERSGAYAFAHPLFRLAVRGAAGSARRAVTHLAIATALTGCGEACPIPEMIAAATCPVVATAATHALTAVELGWPAARPLAVVLGFRAAEHASRLFDPAAASLLEQSLAAWRQLPAGQARALDASGAHMSLANLRMRSGDDVAADAAFRAAIATAREHGELAAAYAAWWWLPYRHGDFEGCLAVVDEALTRLPADATAARAVVEVALGWTLGRLHRMDEAIPHLEHAAAVLEASGDRRAAMRALDQLGMMLHMARRSAAAIGFLERSLALALELGDLHGEFVRIHLGTALVRSGMPGRARPHLERGLVIAHQMGDRYLEAVGSWAAAEMEDALGDCEAARTMRTRELDLLASIGGNVHNEALAHAHLSHLARLAGDPDASEVEAAVARRLADSSDDPGYAARIEEALGVERWADLDTG